MGRLGPRQPPTTSPISGLLDSVMTPGSGGGGGESAVAAAKDYYHFKLNHAQVIVPAYLFHSHTVDIVGLRRSNCRDDFTLRTGEDGADADWLCVGFDPVFFGFGEFHGSTILNHK
ncbi:unnamed protein product [Schistocephalus solidus]|uniref:Peptidase A1 domain-containing protein n=1 Tax=Schistocephalus solidus TaxID=70667 RepID=A0A183TKS7_SCHSO|nr:unnamed protein product [Schistocephalus solidus]